MSDKPTPEVLAMGKINITGNVIPPTWYQHLTYGNGKPRLVAIIILSEIVYWYRPSEERDETTGQLIGYKKKFKSDKLQRSYRSFADQFGVSKKQARDAISYLEERGTIDKELRNITTQGMTLSNVLFIGLYPEEIEKIGIPLQVTPMTYKSHPLAVEVIPSLPESQTYTKNTTETTTDISLPGETDDFSDILGSDNTPRAETPQSNGSSLTETDIAHLRTFGYLPGDKQPAAFDTIQQIRNAGWEIRDPIVEQGMAHFLEAVRAKRPNFAIPNNISIRKDWYKDMVGHLQDYKPNQLPQLYNAVIDRFDKGGYSYSRPGALTKTLPDVVDEVSSGGIVAEY